MAHGPATSPAPDVRARASSRGVFVALALLTLLALGLAMGVPLVDPDEGRNAEVAREMAASGDLLIPHLAGMPYLDKPPALFWAGAAFVRLLGPVPLAVRLPALLAALATLALLAHVSRRIEPDGHAARVVALTAAAPLFATMSAYVIFDMPLTLCVTAVWTMLAAEIAEGSSPRRRAAMFAAVAAGVLVKGPVMLAWAIGGTVAAAVVMRSAAALAWLAWWPGWLVVFGVAGGWFALALQRHPEYARYAFLEESLERMTSGSFRREQPLWFAPAVVAAGALPWSLATPWRKPASPGTRVALGFVLFALVFFTLSRSKLVTYLLPALPALAWLAADAWRRAQPSRAPGAALSVVLALLAAAAFAVAARAAGDPRVPADALLGAAAATFVLTPFALGAALRARPALAFGTALAWTPLVLALGGMPLARFASRDSGAPLAEAIRRAGGGLVRCESCYSPGTDFLLGRASIVVSPLGHEITSNYVVRYRDTLRRRGQWTLADSVAATPAADVIVRPAAHRDRERPAGYDPLHEDARFVAFVRRDRRR